MERSATPWTPATKMPSPISQSASAASWPSSRCFTHAPTTSDIDSLRAPDWREYTSPAVYWVRAWASSWPSTSTGSVNRPNSTPSPSPKTSWVPSQNALA